VEAGLGVSVPPRRRKNRGVGSFSSCGVLLVLYYFEEWFKTRRRGKGPRRGVFTVASFQVHLGRRAQNRMVLPIGSCLPNAHNSLVFE
jgi:hypothetical protein